MAAPSVPPTHKTCRECGETKPVESFEKPRRVCRACRSSYTNAWKKGFRKGPQHPIVNGTHKVCSKCGELKPLEAYRVIKTKEAGPERWRADCKVCTAEYEKAYYAAHPNVRPQRWRTYYDIKQEELCRRANVYYYANQEERMAAHRAWSKANPEKANAHSRKRKTAKRGLPSTFTHEEQAFCRQYFHYACAICTREEGFQWLISLA
jgi:uncharacterized protein (DUF983 family)